MEAVQPGLRHCVLAEAGTAGGETWDSSWSGYHCDVMGEAARGRAGGPPRPREEVKMSLIADCRVEETEYASGCCCHPCFLIRNSCIQRFVKLGDRRVYPDSVALLCKRGDCGC